MVRIALSDEQARQIAEATAPVVLTNPRGEVVGKLAQFSPEDEPLLSHADLKASLAMCDESMAEAASGGGQGLDEALEQTLGHLGRQPQ